MKKILFWLILALLIVGCTGRDEQNLVSLTVVNDTEYPVVFTLIDRIDIKSSSYDLPGGGRLTITPKRGIYRFILRYCKDQIFEELLDINEDIFIFVPTNRMSTSTPQPTPTPISQKYPPCVCDCVKVTQSASKLIPTPTPEKVSLFVINRSSYNVYIKLESTTRTDVYYYLTVAAGTQDKPVVELFTVIVDVYNRNTWQCDGLRSTDILTVDGNTQLTFPPCEENPLEP